MLLLRLFSGIRSHPGFEPSLGCFVRLGLALKVNGLLHLELFLRPLDGLVVRVGANADQVAHHHIYFETVESVATLPSIR